MSNLEKKITLVLDNPKYKIGEIVYVPNKDSPIETKIRSYVINAWPTKKGIAGTIKGYTLEEPLIVLRRCSEGVFCEEVYNHDLYKDKIKAERASKFLKVKMANEEWKLAIGDKKIEDPDSPYHIDNSELQSCCANISEVRNILIYCKRNGRLIKHDIYALKANIQNHKFTKANYLKKIFEQLKIKPQ